MSSTTYDALLAQVDRESGKVASVVGQISKSSQWWKIFFKAYSIYKSANSILDIISKLEKERCDNCSTKCDSDIKGYLSKMVDGITSANSILGKSSGTKYLMPYFTKVLADYENKLENYWIATDNEVKEFAMKLSARI
jgi:hypothetical protein